MKIVHIISGLGVGGAEVCLCRFVEQSQKDSVQNVVISLSGEGDVAPRLRRSGCEVLALNMGKSWRTLYVLLELVRLVRRIGPDVVQTWMYHADLAGGLMVFISRLVDWFDLRRPRSTPTLVWGVHHTAFPRFREGFVLGAVARLCARLSSAIPDAIICCADAARVSHIKHGYCSKKIYLVRNGFDTELFRPCKSARDDLRMKLGLPADCRIVGIAGRYHAIKDIGNFIDAVAIVGAREPDIQFVMMGHGFSKGNGHLEDRIAVKGLESRVHLMGPTSNIQESLAGLDVFCLSSRSEGLPTVIGEAMSCGVPCVATDVGDTASLIGETGVVVPPKDSIRLADGILSIVNLSSEERRELGQRARHRIVRHFPLHAACRGYLRLYGRLRVR
ncbi:glycosyltransferase [Paraburkholderia aromaticivorans]|uniref:Glycosyltransferase subfamily 4-like N-terminal domain-containing protein n=1 Tax=Paraburkholderia aromaticivorans TaxID=2026199 RepID=A0A248VTF6_9BURK|nr:glycosyltransferase [Paraburkholderia aromaticivorans]ASW01792.1 hypothetical protein CJU94_26985 [Paraburkholderia aromaticivorans]